MCNALEELMLEGRLEGRLEGIRATIRTCKNFNISYDMTLQSIIKEFTLSEKEATDYMKQYW